jgi:hypothetical protein
MSAEGALTEEAVRELRVNTKYRPNPYLRPETFVGANNYFDDFCNSRAAPEGLDPPQKLLVITDA